MPKDSKQGYWPRIGDFTRVVDAEHKLPMIWMLQSSNM